MTEQQPSRPPVAPAAAVRARAARAAARAAAAGAEAPASGATAATGWVAARGAAAAAANETTHLWRSHLRRRGAKVGLSGPAAGSSAATECVGYSAARLAAAEAAHRVRCTWVCIHASLHCVSHAHQDFKAQGSHLKGAEWEAGCKRMINARFELEGTDAVVAGLFGGDYLPLVSAKVVRVRFRVRVRVRVSLPLVSAKVGREGTVYGFEPTDAVDVSRALADANGLSNVKIEHACLSSDHSVVRMCMRDARAEPG